MKKMKKKRRKNKKREGKKEEEKNESLLDSHPRSIIILIFTISPSIHQQWVYQPPV